MHAAITSRHFICATANEYAGAIYAYARVSRLARRGDVRDVCRERAAPCRVRAYATRALPLERKQSRCHAKMSRYMRSTSHHRLPLPPAAYFHVAYAAATLLLLRPPPPSTVYHTRLPRVAAATPAAARH